MSTPTDIKNSNSWKKLRREIARTAFGTFLLISQITSLPLMGKETLNGIRICRNKKSVQENQKEMIGTVLPQKVRSCKAWVN